MAGAEHPSGLTPQERLALSRRALVRELHGGQETRDRQERAAFADGETDANDAGAAFEGQRAHGARPSGRGGRNGNARLWTSVARSMAERWWRRHPAHAVGQLARPVLEHYARDRKSVV